MIPSPLTRRPRDLLTVLGSLERHHPVATHAKGRLFESFADSVELRSAIALSLQRIARTEFGHDVELPPTPLAEASVAADMDARAADVLVERIMQYDVALDASLRQCPYFGRVEYAGPHECVFRYCDATKTYDALQTTHHIRTHEHHLVQAQERKLSDPQVFLPRKQRRILRLLPKEVYPQVRVVTGLLVLQKEADGGTVRRDHAVGRTLRQVGHAAKTYGRGAARGVAAGAAAAGIVAGLTTLISAVALSWAATAATVGTVAVVAAADPALVLGDLVISGWIEEQEGQP